ncbi:MAG TPA: S-methyl-5-thioribose-1-phosphate isomerase, partial [Firmicutes bacterium]|nr:S-methyl-5-thioribose-1-phosphate isomerase [Bacillota bacterium]
MEHILWQENQLILLDQRYLPYEENYVKCSTYQDVALAIKDMVVRGAPAIGVSA